MPKKTKKMKAVPSTEVVEKTYYTTLTEEQYETINSIIRWDNPIEQIDDITGMGDITNIEMGYRLGKLYCEFKETFSKLQKVMDEIEPEIDEEEDSEEDDNYEFED